MRKKTVQTAAFLALGAAFGLPPAVKRIKKTVAAHADDKKALSAGDRLVQSAAGAAANRVSDKAIGEFNRPSFDGFLEGSGYFLTEPKPGAAWRVGYASADIIPEKTQGDLFLGGYLAFPPNRVSGSITDQFIRATALDDGSGRGVHVFAAVDCIGLSNTDVKEIRSRLREEISRYNIESLNLSATHCHSGVDTLGVWGDLMQAVKKNPKLVKSKKGAGDAVSGRNPDFMEQFFETAADCIRRSLLDLRPATASFTALDAAAFVRDKRKPDVIDPNVTVVRFEREAARPLYWVFLGAHPTCYGASQREISADFPYYICKTLEHNGVDGVFYQGASAAVAANRAPSDHPADTRNESIEHFGEAIGRRILGIPAADFKSIEPMLNVKISPLLLPADNKILLLAGKLKLVNHTMRKFPKGKKKFDYCFESEVGYAEFGKDLRLAMVPGELMPEIAYGGAYSAAESYNGTAWSYPPLCDCVSGRLAVLGLCNDMIGYIVPDNDFGSVFAKQHYEEAVSPGKRTAGNIAAQFIRTVNEAEKIRIQAFPEQSEE